MAEVSRDAVKSRTVTGVSMSTETKEVLIILLKLLYKIQATFYMWSIEYRILVF
jgi:hypothetical protein